MSCDWTQQSRLVSDDYQTSLCSRHCYVEPTLVFQKTYVAATITPSRRVDDDFSLSTLETIDCGHKQVVYVQL